MSNREQIIKDINLLGHLAADANLIKIRLKVRGFDMLATSAKEVSYRILDRRTSLQEHLKRLDIDDE